MEQPSHAGEELCISLPAGSHLLTPLTCKFWFEGWNLQFLTNPSIQVFRLPEEHTCSD